MALWSSVVDDYDLEEHERTLLVQAVRTVDLPERLDEEVRRDGSLVESPQGQKAHPAATEAPSAAHRSGPSSRRSTASGGRRGRPAGRRPTAEACGRAGRLRHPRGCPVRRCIPPVEFSLGKPPQELLRFAPRTSSEWTAAAAREAGRAIG